MIVLRTHLFGMNSRLKTVSTANVFKGGACVQGNSEEQKANYPQ
jgi:hypothetical protein